MNIYNQEATGRDKIRVVLRNTNKLIKKRMFCPCCGQYIFSYYDELAILIDGNSEPQSRQVDVECMRCKIIYQIV